MGQALPRLRQRPPVHVPPRLQDPQHPVELARQRLHAPFDAALEALHVANQPIGALEGPEVGASVGAAGDRVGCGRRGLGQGDLAAPPAPRRGGPAVVGRRVDPSGNKRRRHLALKPGVVRGVGHGQAHLGDGEGRSREVAGSERDQPPVGRHRPHPDVATPPPRRGQDGHSAPGLGAGHDEDITRPDPFQGGGDLGRHRRALPGCFLAGPQQAPVFLDVAPVTGRRGPGLGEGCTRALELGLQPDHVAVGPVLGERQVEQVVGHVRPVPAHQIGRHVVSGPEAAGQGVAAGAGQPRHLVERHEGRPQHHGVTDVVDAPAPGAARQLGVLTGGQELVTFARELGELLDHY